MNATAPARHEVPLTGAAREAWESALDLWGVHLHDARLAPGTGLAHGAPAWFTFPPEITVDPVMVEQFGGSAELESVFAHEIGHHVLAPSTRIDALKIRHQLARALVAAGAPGLREREVALLANLWSDLLVNARVAHLQRVRDAAGGPGGEPGIVRFARLFYRSGMTTTNRLWWVYLRSQEITWGLPAGTLAALQPPPPAVFPERFTQASDDLDRLPKRHRDKERAHRAAVAAALAAQLALDRSVVTNPEVDARLAAVLVRTFAADPVGGALRFGVLAAPYLVEQTRYEIAANLETGADPGFPCNADDAPATGDEVGRVLADRRMSGPVPTRSAEGFDDAGAAPQDVGDRRWADDDAASGGGQGFGVARTLALYSSSDAAAVQAAWYRSRAAPWVRPFTRLRPAQPTAELPGPIDAWEVGDDLADLDWPQTLQAGSVVIPGVTTRRRTYLDDDPTLLEEAGLELDLYIDSSGSMPHPSRGSPAVLAGTILALSVLRGGGRVRVTSFSGPGQVAGSGFSRDHVGIVNDLAFFYSSSTSFPLDLLDERYRPLPPARDDMVRHLVVLSDDGLVSMFGVGNRRFAHVAKDTRAKLTTATLVLLDHSRQVDKRAAKAGYDVLYLDTMDQAPEICSWLAEVLRG